MNQLTPLTLLVAALVARPVTAQEPEAPAKAPKTKTSANQDEAKKAPAVLIVGAAIPADLKLRNLDGQDFAFKDQLGKVVVIHFWSATCPWEKVAEPKLNQLADDFKGKDVVMVAINANSGEIGAEPDATAFAAKDAKDKPYQNLRKKAAAVKLNHDVLIDHSGDVARLFGAKTTPHCFVIDAEGVLQYAGGLDNDGKSPEVAPKDQYVRRAVDALRAGKPVETPTSKPYG